MKSPRIWLALSLGAFFAVTALEARAQQAEPGFALDRFEPSERGSNWFSLESLDLRGSGRFAAGLVLDYGKDPLVIYGPDGEKVSAVVADQFFAHVGASLVVWDRVRFGVNLPIALVQDGDAGTASSGSFSSENSSTVGDLRLAADIRLAGEYGDPVTFAGGLRVFAPTGSRDSFTGDGSVRIVPRLMLAGDVGSFTYAAHAGFNGRTQGDDFGDADLGSEILFGAAAGLRAADRKLTIGPELYGATGVASGDAFFGKLTTPLELIVGGHYQAGDWQFGLGVGPGLTRGLGTPAYRLLASIEFAPAFEKPLPPPAPVVDRDGDGILDNEDACPDEPGVRTSDPATNGCPAPKDRDGDGIMDDVDACPDQPGVKSVDPKKNGCPPPPDRDGDKILDADDACPDEAGVPNEDPKKNGCPPPKDRDGDSITDDVDACPDAAGEPNADPKKHGCPVARVEEGQIKIREQVQFAYNSAQILKASDFIIEAVTKILQDHAEIKKVSIEGHTDSKGGDAFNKALSQQRATAVMKALTKKGIDKKRLSAKGYGEEKPLDTNDTEEGRANNRRVEFHIVEQEGALGEAGAPGAGASAPSATTPSSTPPAGAPKKKPAAAEPDKNKSGNPY